MRTSILLILFISLGVAVWPKEVGSFVAEAASQNDNSPLSTVDQIKEDVTNVPCRDKDRQAGVRALFQKMGAPPESVTTIKQNGVENLVLRESGSREIIVVGAHYDFVDFGCGAVDNWTGIVTIAHLYRSIHRLRFQKTILFVAFGKEEAGLFGSKAMVKAIAKDQVPQYCAMINIDSLGMGYPFALKNASAPSLMVLAKESAEGLKIPFATIAIDIADADSSSFVRGKIPAVTLSGLNGAWRSVLHTIEDQTSQIDPTSVYLGYRLALLMWSEIDKAPCEAYR